MNPSQVRNIIVLKDLPSNLIDEAFVILKSNKKIKSLEHIEKQGNNKSQKQNSKDYIVKEAEMIVSNYLSKVENEKQIKSHSMRQIENKYKRMKKINIILGILLAVNIILQIIWKFKAVCLI